jgi:Ubiquitin carboxyl-terminal hydrolase
MCLKRYSYTERGKAVRLNTRIDIPIEIGLPHFISDDKMDEDGPIYGSFKLSLQSVVCHRGSSVDSGHYISLVRGTNASSDTEEHSDAAKSNDHSHWMRFDDLASERITLIDINQALRDETPYLLFYQIVPISGDPLHGKDEDVLPLYAPSEAHDSGISGLSVGSLRTSNEEMPPPSKPSFEVTAAEERARGRSPIREERRRSVTFSEPPGQAELSVPEAESSQSSSQRGSIYDKSASQSRSQSQTGEKLSISLSRITRKKSKDAVPTLKSSSEVEAAGRSIPEITTAGDDKGKGVLRKEGKREKSKNRLSKRSNMAGRNRGEKPDRECSVM